MQHNELATRNSISDNIQMDIIRILHHKYQHNACTGNDLYNFKYILYIYFVKLAHIHISIYCINYYHNSHIICNLKYYTTLYIFHILISLFYYIVYNIKYCFINSSHNFMSIIYIYYLYPYKQSMHCSIK
jgi:hypothetical protein